MPEEEFNPDEFERRLREQLATSRAAFQSRYKDELNALSGLSREEIDAISPGKTDLQKYDELIALVKEASRVNLAQADLIQQIKALGDVAVAIAKKVPSLAALL
ncbi:MAG TPA: hypothetical protein VEC06_04920 [Paucimonas sp.]|nr:hypothetical protein [Paucimonas sp.]